MTDAFDPAKRLAVEEAELPRQVPFPSWSLGTRGKSDYAIALGEKQKLRYQYGLLEKQFRRIIQTALRKRGVTGETLLHLLEMRLDNVVFRLGLANTRSEPQSLPHRRQMDRDSVSSREENSFSTRPCFASLPEPPPSPHAKWIPPQKTEAKS